MQNGAAAAIDGAHPLRIQAQDMGLAAVWVVRIVIQRAGPAAAKPHHIPATRQSGARDRLDAGVESRHIPAARKNAYAHVSTTHASDRATARSAGDLFVAVVRPLS